MRYRVKLEWDQDDGVTATADLGEVECGACVSAADVGLTLANVKPLLARLQEVVIAQQLHRYYEAARLC